MSINKKQRKTLEAIFRNPVSPSIVWTDIEALLEAVGASKSEGKGSRIRFKLNEIKAIFHRPHPEPITDKGAVKSVRRFLEAAGVKP
ncbi:MAG TPA: hexulose-6-phosphate isomerase [Desulfovibrio sp.]|nr:hexulose-6-phosphate isomerase [Desulfovibrio sp.]